MVDIEYTPEFERRYQELSKAVQRKAEKRERLFRRHPFEPVLKTEKLEPRAKEYWSFRIDRNYRIIFRFIDSNRVIFLTCGHHHWIYRYLLSR